MANKPSSRRRVQNVVAERRLHPGTAVPQTEFTPPARQWAIDCGQVERPISIQKHLIDFLQPNLKLTLSFTRGVKLDTLDFTQFNPVLRQK
ncbi:MAG: hypothetical protein A2Z90_13910 [Burkholderiales bacterium GWA2_64_37]|nr:MAG: hypothetical protein A2Z90_13910 [Burkholderiales bacterium GWA2_64_37]